MSGATVADLLADLIGPAKSEWSGGTPAKVANPAKNRASIDAAGDSRVCEGLRKVANSQADQTTTAPDSQKFAGLRSGCNQPQSEHPCGFSQDSQNSQGVAGTNEPARGIGNPQFGKIAGLQAAADRDAVESDSTHAKPTRPYKLTPAEADAAHAEPWNDAACARFVARVSLILRRGINATDADDLAERLHLRDVHADHRHLCVECRHYRPHRCGNHRAAGLTAADVGRDLATMFQHCPGFSEVL